MAESSGSRRGGIGAVYVVGLFGWESSIGRGEVTNGVAVGNGKVVGITTENSRHEAMGRILKS